MMATMADRSARLELYLVRHADAGDPLAWTRPDEERPLSAKGHRQAERIGDRVTNIAEDVVFLSTGDIEDLNP